jgi:hypothetical protein
LNGEILDSATVKSFKEKLTSSKKMGFRGNGQYEPITNLGANGGSPIGHFIPSPGNILICICPGELFAKTTLKLTTPTKLKT